MNQLSVDLPLVCLIPALILCGYVLYKDRLEPEPVGLLALLFGAGVVCGAGGFFAQKYLIVWLDTFFANSMEMMENGLMVYSSNATELLHQSLCAFVGISLVQILLKWAAMFLLTHRNKNFNYIYDGVVYATVLSLGYALAECGAFAFVNGVEMLAPKLLASIPAHLFVGILMGWFYTMWRARFMANRIEKKLLKAGLAQEDRIRSSAPWLVMSFLVPMALDGLYFLTANRQGSALTTLFITTVFVLYGISFIVIDRLASSDRSCKRYLVRMIAAGHPDVDMQQLEAIVDGDDEEAADEEA